MTWSKLDDRWHNHPKLLAAGESAMLLHARAINYCCAYDTGGTITEVALRGLCFRPRRLPGIIRDLLRYELVHESGPGIYEIHDYSEYQFGATEVQEHKDSKRRKLSERGRKAADARWRKHASSIDQASAKHASSIACGMLANAPEPEPVPEPKTTTTVASAVPTPEPSPVEEVPEVVVVESATPVRPAGPVVPATPGEISTAGAMAAYVVAHHLGVQFTPSDRMAFEKLVSASGPIQADELVNALDVTRRRTQRPGDPVRFFLGVIRKGRESAAAWAQPAGAPKPARRVSDAELRERNQAAAAAELLAEEEAQAEASLAAVPATVEERNAWVADAADAGEAAERRMLCARADGLSGGDMAKLLTGLLAG